MVIISSCGFQIKDKCGDLLKLVKNRKVFICTNALDREIKKNQFVENAKINISPLASRIDYGTLDVDNILKYVNYYDCIYMAGGNVKLLSETLNHKEVKQGLEKFINSGKLFITQGNAGLIVIKDLSYLDNITSSITEEDFNYPKLQYAKLNTLALTDKKIIVFPNNINYFKSACKFYEKKNRTALTYIDNGEFIVL